MTSPVNCTPIEPALISKCELVHEQIRDETIKEIRHCVFERETDHLNSGGSPFQQWYRTIATGHNAFKITDTDTTRNGTKKGVGVVQGRLIAWKTDTPFLPENLFFRALDTAKLLPMNLATFRIQMYAHAAEWERMEGLEGISKKGYIYILLSGIMHEILLLRNMHDRGGADIPIIVVGWTQREISLAMDYWVGLSKGEWSEEERNARYAQVNASFCLYLRPCFPQVDLLVRSLYQDPAVGYVPPFIILYPTPRDARACALFTTPENCPPKAMLASWPLSCNGPECTKSECGSFRFENCRSLVKGSRMVRQSVWPTGLVMCNLWMCTARHCESGAENDGGSVTLQRCQRCKEALYCCASHQKIDWPSHKLVCENLS